MRFGWKCVGVSIHLCIKGDMSVNTLCNYICVSICNMYNICMYMCVCEVYVSTGLCCIYVYICEDTYLYISYYHVIFICRPKTMCEIWAVIVQQSFITRKDVHTHM